MAWSAAAAVSRFAASPAAEIRLPFSAAAAASVSFAGRRRFGPVAASLAALLHLVSGPARRSHASRCPQLRRRSSSSMPPPQASPCLARPPCQVPAAAAKSLLRAPVAVDAKSNSHRAWIRHVQLLTPVDFTKYLYRRPRPWFRQVPHGDPEHLPYMYDFEPCTTTVDPRRPRGPRTSTGHEQLLPLRDVPLPSPRSRVPLPSP